AALRTGSLVFWPERGDPTRGAAKATRGGAKAVRASDLFQPPIDARRIGPPPVARHNGKASPHCVGRAAAGTAALLAPAIFRFAACFRSVRCAAAVTAALLLAMFRVYVDTASTALYPP